MPPERQQEEQQEVLRSRARRVDTLAWENQIRFGLEAPAINVAHADYGTVGDAGVGSVGAVRDMREQAIEMAREAYREGGELLAYDTLMQHFPFNTTTANREIDKIREEFGDEEPMGSRVNRFLRGDKVEGMTKEIANAYLLEEKKKRFLKRGERDLLHKPESDGDKPTSSVKLDDLCPA
jgi:hypothetical protein